MIDDSNTDSGSAIATFVADAYNINSRIIYQSNPFPIRSSMYLNKNNINNTNVTNITVMENASLNDMRKNKK